MKLNETYETHLAVILQYYIIKQNLISNSALLLESHFLNSFEDILKASYTNNTEDKLKDEFKNEVNNLIMDIAKEDFPQVVLRAIFSNSYNIFENQLVSLCELLYKSEKLNLNINDINGKGFKKIKTYLKKVIQVPVDEIKELSDRIIDYSEIRNIILHRNGVLRDSHLVNKTWVINDFLNADKKYVSISIKSILLSNEDYFRFYRFLYEKLCPNSNLEYLKLFTT